MGMPQATETGGVLTKRTFGADESGKTFGPPAPGEVSWCVTHRFTGERRFQSAQTAYMAVQRAGWTFSEALAVKVDG